jgi:hypothetical protein
MIRLRCCVTIFGAEHNYRIFRASPASARRYRDGAYGIIFQGTIKRIKTGRENATDTFIEIMAADGYYRAIVVSHKGDNRGNDFYTRLICLAIDSSAAAGASVMPYG